MAEQLTVEIAREYQQRARALPDNGFQDIGGRRDLRMELQQKFGLTELEALNVLNGRHTRDIICISERRAWEDEHRRKYGDGKNTGRVAKLRREP